MLIKAFLENVKKNPRKVAIRTNEKSKIVTNEVTYEELNLYSNKVAHRILDKLNLIYDSEQDGNKRVALLFEHGIDMIVGTLGALKACKIYVPFDPTYPEQRLLFMLENSESELIVTNDANYEMAQSLITKTSKVVEILNIDEKSDYVCDEDIERESNGDRIAYLLYTSGSTGTPKGIMQTHKNVLHFIENYIERFQITENDKLTLFSTFGHDAAVMDIYSGLLRGATLYPLNIKKQINIDNLFQWLREEEITIWHSVPTLYRFFIGTLTGKEKLDTLRYIVLGGESVLERDVANFRKLSEHATLVNLYGQSESSFNSSQRIQNLDEFDGINLGEPINDIKMLVLNKKNKVAAPFSLGEIVIASDYLALGYWRNKEKTERAFENHPELGRIYRTGDMGCLTEEGVIEYRGRNDFQIKIRGYRVELEEVENCILKYETVKSTAVIGKSDTMGNIYLSCFFVSDEILNVEVLREFVGKELPDYMIPTYFTKLDELPLTPTGKIDRTALREIKEAIASEMQYESPRNEIEQKLVEIWQEILGIEKIGINDSFFEMGGHSLNAVNLIGRIHKEFNVELPLKEIFNTPTIKILSNCIEGLGQSKYITIEQAEKRDYYELSSAQKRMYLLQNFEPDSISYNMPGVLIIEGELNVEQLKKAMREIVKRHEALRTSFTWVREEIVQLVHETVPFEVVYNQGQEEEIDVAIKTFINPFDLSCAPLFRVGLLKVSTDKHILMYDMHHIISDGTSIAILVEEFVKLYQGKELPTLRLQYKDYITWQNKSENKEKIQQQGEYWLELLKGEIPLLDMPLDYQRKGNISFAGDSIHLELKSGITEQLKRLAQKENITMNILLLACYNILLNKYSEQEEIITGSLVSNRNHMDLSQVMGAFINYLPIKSKIDNQKSLVDFLQSQKNIITQAYNHQEYPFDQMVANIEYKAENGRNPIFDTMLIYHNEFDRKVDVKIDNLNISKYEFNTPTSTLDFKLDIYMDKDETLKCYLEYKTSLYKEEAMRKFLGHYEMILEAVINNGNTKLSDINIFNQQEKQEIENRRRQSSINESILTLTIAATFTAEPIEEHVRWWCEKHKLGIEIQFAPYNQVFQELLDKESLISKNTGINLLLVRFEDWLRNIKGNEQEKKQILESNYTKLLEAINNRSKQSEYIICIFPVADYLGFNSEITNQIKNLYNRLRVDISGKEGIIIQNFTQLSELYNIKDVFDDVADKEGHMPFSEQYYAAIGTMVARKICAIRYNPFKVIAVDCDNTLWRGICGEDGSLGIQIEKPYVALQKKLIEKYEEGMLIVLCSKNNEEDVWEVFDRNPNMLLKREHLAGWQINWKTKSENIPQLAEELNLGIDSFIFIDDSPAESLDMMKNNPQVLTLQLPEPQQIEQYLKHIWAFDKEKVTGEDRRRTKLYQVEKQRKQIEKSSFNLDEFLKELKPKVYINDMKKEQLSRVSQLTHRTNQFNLSTIRRTEDQIAEELKDFGTKCWTIEVEDKFGEYGLTGVIIMKKRLNFLYIDTLLLSCRVLGRGIETAIIAELGKYCQREGIGSIEADYIPTNKNQMVADYLEKSNWLIKDKNNQHTKYRIEVSSIATPTAYIECYFGEPCKVCAMDSEVKYIKRNIAVAEETQKAEYKGLESKKELVKNNWQINIENEEQLTHLNYLLPLRYCTGQMLLELTACKTKAKTLHREAYEAPRNSLEEKLVKLWEDILNTDEISINDNFYEIGGNSFLLLKLHAKLDELYPNRLKVTDLFHLSNIRKIADYINQEEADKCIVANNEQERTIKDKIAIIGVGAKLPLGKNLEEIYEGLKNGTDSIKVMSDNRRQDIEDFVRFAGGSEESLAFLKKVECGFIGEIDKFDYNFFNISPKEASLMDPCQRLFLETAWEAIEDAGYGGNKIKGSSTGVFIGHNSLASGTYSKLVTTVDESLYQMSIAGNVPMIMASRISYILDLRGPAMLIDTACSSSLISVYSACNAIRNNDCDMAIAGGIKLYLPSIDGMVNGMEKLGIVSSNNRTKAFDDNSDGTGFGEGVSAILLKPLSKALEDGDNIYAVIDGGAMNQDGNSIGITAPNPEAQEQLLQKAWKNAGVSPENITYIEAHGTGTKLGDQIELESLSKAFRKHTQKMQFCAVSSIKTNMGHLESAAGIAGLLKAIISLKYKELFPNIHFTMPRKEIAFESAPYYVTTMHQPWDTQAIPRTCGVSSFGLGGTNCHLVLEEAPYWDYDEEIWGEMPQILTLSAKTENSLKRLIIRYKEYFEEGIKGNLTDICYTANTTRGHYKYRMAIIARSKMALEEKINDLAGEYFGGDEVQGIYYSNDVLAGGNSNVVILKSEEQILEKSLNELCELYVNGAEINWQTLYQNGDKRRIIRLPAYQFEESRCWVSIPKDAIGSNYNKTKTLVIDKETKEIQLEGKSELEYTQTEKLTGQILGEILGYNKLNIYDNFYQLGGDSLIAMEVVNEVNKKLLTNVKVIDLLKNPTLWEFSCILDEEYLKILTSSDQIKNIKKIEKREYYPASSAQKRVYVLNMLESNSTFYNIPSVIMLSGNIDKLRFESAFNMLIKRHESLRTSFEMIEDNLVQRIHEHIDFKINYIKGDGNSTDILIKEFIRPFDLRLAPLMRIGLLQISKDKHLLMFDIHHIVADGLSNSIIIKECLQLYNGDTLSPLTLQYKDYAVWQNEQIDTELINNQKEYWMDVFSGELPILNIPTDFVRPNVQSFEGDIIRAELSGDIVKALNKRAIECGTTLFVVLLATYNVLLHKYTGQEDIIVGSPISGRRDAQFKNVIGMFANTIALRNKPMSNKTFKEFLKEVKDNSLSSYDKQDFQFEDLVDSLNVRRDLSRNPLFDTMLVLQSMEVDMEAVLTEGLLANPYEIDYKVSKFDLTITAIEKKDSITLVIEYCTKLFKRDTIERMGAHFINILKKIIEEPDAKLEQIEIISKIEKQNLIWNFNKVEAEYPREKTICQLFEEQVAKTPNEIAVACKQNKLTYKELNKKSNQLARLLRENGTTTDKIVAIVAERSVELIIGIMAVLKAGGAYLPIDPDYPTDRISYMLEDSDVDILLTQKHMKSHSRFDGTIIELDNETTFEGTAENVENLDSINNSDNLAYVIYTSGSTGKPKGVMVGHRQLVNYIWWAIKSYLNEGKGDFTLYTSISFDLTVTSIFVPIISGNSILVYDNKNSAVALEHIMQDNKASIIKLTPSHLKLIKDKDNTKSSIECFIVGGEQLEVQLAKEIKDSFNGRVRIFNEYGPTEATVGCMIHQYDSTKDTGLSVPIGVPADNVNIYILDKSNNIQAEGIAGELCIGGSGLAKGYIKKPELTAERFIENPFILGTKMYRTGDLARMLSTGEIEYLGRMDHQVKIRGYRIELGEIEKELLKYPHIKEVAVIERSDSNSNKYLCAYINSLSELSVTVLRKFLAESLPDYMIPSYFIQLDKLPLTNNGKLDKNALPEPSGNMDTGIEYEAPRNDIEEKLVEIWRDILHIDKIGINNSFFELGGHSLKATSMMGRLQKDLEVQISLSDIFKMPTVKELADYIKGLDKNVAITIQPAKESKYYELSPAQNRLYTLQLMDKDSTVFNTFDFVEIQGFLDNNKLEKVIKNLINRHEALRTSFELLENGPVQIIHKEIEFEIQYEEAKDNEEVNVLLKNFIRPFDLSKAPLLRIGLIKIDTGDKAVEKHILAYDLHHIISDGVSSAILAEEFIRLWEGKELPELCIQYKDYVGWQLGRLKGEAQRKYEEYWLHQFGGELPVLQMPTDYPRPSTQNYDGDIYTFKIEEDLFSKLKEFATQTEATLFMVLLEILSITLSKYSGQEDIIIGTVSAGRLKEETQNLVGLFLNNIAIRCLPAKEKTAVSYLQELQENVLNMYENQTYPIEDLIRKLNIKKDMSRNVLFDVMLILQNFERQNAQISVEELSIKPYPWTNKVSDYDMSLYAAERGKELIINVQYCTKLFKEASMKSFGQRFCKVAKEIISKPEQQLKDITLLEEKEAEKIIYEYNNKKAEYTKEKTLHQLFEEQVEKTPENIAVVYEDKQLTYREVNYKANKLAGYLKDRISGNSVIAIMSEKSVEMLIGIIAILKSGGAYLPVDPTYPLERINYMLEDSQTELVLVQNKLKDRISIDIDKVLLEDEAIYVGSKDNLGITSDSRELAYIIYTSGTTGKPKGIMTEHQNVIAYVSSFNSMFGLTEKDATLQQASITFDGFVEEVYSMLICGGKVVIPRDEQIKEAKELRKVITKNGVTILSCSPLILSEFNKLEPMKTVHTFLSSSDILKKEYYTNIMKTAKVYNMYGPSEATVCTTCYLCTGEEENIVPIGKPITNYKLYILDEMQRPQPVGILGEIYISGEGISRGYINKPDLTNEKFILDPYAEGDRMFRTGDLARWLEGGNIEFIGRADNQVKIRGYRIEIGEIESTLLKHTEIQEAVVIIKEDKQQEKYLTAYITGRREMTVGEIREHLKERLPEYMFPQYYVQLEKMPLNPNGKIDRKALPEPNVNMIAQRGYEAPRNEIENKLVKIWSELLFIDTIGISDNFFELGGHSLKATSLVSRIHKELNTEVPLREIFALATIKGIAEYINKQKQNAYSAIEKVAEKEYYTASSAQQRMYALQQFDLSDTSYNMTGIVKIEGKLDKERLKKSFIKLIERHESLRTSFAIKDGEIVQIIHDKIDFNIEYKQNKAEEEINKFVRAFDLRKAPLLRVGLIEIQDNKHILMYDMHHIISDGVSMNILIEEFVQAYAGKELRKLPLQYKDYAEWQNKQKETELMKKQEEYWYKQYMGNNSQVEIPVLKLATDFTRPEIQSFEGARIRTEISKELTDKLRQISKEAEATMYMVMLTGFNILLSKYSGQEDIVVGSPIAGRPHWDLENIIGMFVNTLAIRNSPKGEKTVREFLREVKENSLKAYENQDYQFEELVETLNIQRDIGRNPIFDVMFVMQNIGMKEMSVEGLTFKECTRENNTAMFDLNMEVIENKDNMNLILSYKTKLYSENTARSFLNSYIEILETMINNMDNKISPIKLKTNLNKLQASDEEMEFDF